MLKNTSSSRHIYITALAAEDLSKTATAPQPQRESLLAWPHKEDPELGTVPEANTEGLSADLAGLPTKLSSDSIDTTPKPVLEEGSKKLFRHPTAVAEQDERATHSNTSAPPAPTPRFFAEIGEITEAPPLPPQAPIPPSSAPWWLTQPSAATEIEEEGGHEAEQQQQQQHTRRRKEPHIPLLEKLALLWRDEDDQGDHGCSRAVGEADEDKGVNGCVRDECLAVISCVLLCSLSGLLLVLLGVRVLRQGRRVMLRSCLFCACPLSCVQVGEKSQ